MMRTLLTRGCGSATCARARPAPLAGHPSVVVLALRSAENSTAAPAGFTTLAGARFTTTASGTRCPSSSTAAGARLFSSAVDKSNGAPAVEEGIDDDAAAADGAKSDPILACPATLGDLIDSDRSSKGDDPAARWVSFKTSEKMPGTKYRVEADFVDFAEPAKPSRKLSKGESVKEGTFRSPVVTWLYERGWRQFFNLHGFPGIDEEFRQVTEYFSSTGADGGAVIDLSCGSGLMMRRLVASERYSRVIGGDLSPTMLVETARRFKQEGLGDPELIRCDVSKLPLKTGSVDGIHAGAAMHCWSKVEESVSEVHRVLKPGKGFFASTFHMDASMFGSGDKDAFKFFELDEMETLMRDAGFADVKAVKEGRGCVIVRATKG